MKNPDLTGSNRRALVLILVGILLAAILMSLPLYRFNAGVYTKKSPNTFIGDEKYQAIRAEVEAEAERFREQGLQVEITEDVLERVNSKGETTSLVTFTIQESFSKNVFSFLGRGLPSSHVLLILLLLLAAALVCTLLGSFGSMDTLHRYLGRRTAFLRGAACAALLLAMLLVPVFVLMNNYAFNREIGLYNAELLTEGRDAFFAALDRFLFDGQMGGQIDKALGGLKTEHAGLIWMLLPALFLSLCAALQLRFGAIRSALLRGCLYFFVVVVCVITLYPYYVMTITAFRSNAETLNMYFLHMFPTKWLWSNLSDIIHRGVPRYLFNSLLVSVLRQVLALIPAAWLLSRTGDVNMIWWAFPIAELVSLAASAFFLRSALKGMERTLSGERIS